MKEFKPDKQIKLMICEQMGEDIDHPVCEELSRFMEECPECKVYFDSVKKIVKMYRQCEQDQDIPDAVSQRLIKTLKLDL